MVNSLIPTLQPANGRAPKTWLARSRFQPGGHGFHSISSWNTNRHIPLTPTWIRVAVQQTNKEPQQYHEEYRLINTHLTQLDWQCCSVSASICQFSVTLPICCLTWRLNVTSYLQSNVPAALRLDSFLHLCWHVTSGATKWVTAMSVHGGKIMILKHQNLQDGRHSCAFCLHRGRLRHFTQAVARTFVIVIKLPSRLAGQYHDLYCQTILMYPLLHILP